MPAMKLALMFGATDSLGGEGNLWATIIFLLIGWLGFNVTFAAWRLYATLHKDLGVESDVVGYPTLQNN